MTEQSNVRGRRTVRLIVMLVVSLLVAGAWVAGADEGLMDAMILGWIISILYAVWA